MKKINKIPIITIGYIIGILIGLYLKNSIALFLTLITIIYSLLKKNKKTKKYTNKLINQTTFIILITSILLSNIIITQKENKFKNTYKNTNEIQVTAIVKSQVQEKEYGNEFKIQITNTNLKHTKLIVTDKQRQKIQYGDIIKIKGKYKKIISYKNKGAFNYEKYLKKENIYGKLEVEKIEKIGQSKNPYKIFIQINQTIKNKLETNFSSQTSSMLKALILGDKDEIDDKIKDQFRDNGLSHILAISGMHISCIILISQKILDKISKSNNKKKIILIILLTIYGLTIGFISSAIRAIIMASLGIIAKLIHRKNNKLIDISIACLIIILYNPYYITDSGFLLSFGATIGIIYIFPKINKIKIKSKFIKYFFEIFLVSIAVNISILPIIIYFFKKISISFFITGLVMTPLVFLIEILGIISIIIPNTLLSTITPLIEITITLFIKISEINLGSIYIKVPTILEITIYYLIITYLLKTNIRKKLKSILKKIIITLTIISTLTNIIITTNNNLKINLIDVGQGDSCLIQTPQKQNILIDGGGSEEQDLGKNVLIPYLLSKRINKIDYLLVSHFDTDHVRTDY